MSDQDDLSNIELPSDELGRQGEGPFTFSPKVNPNDAVTHCSGFINDVRVNMKDPENPLYFIRCGLITGSEKDENNEWQGKIQNVDLLCGHSVISFAGVIARNSDIFKGIRFSFSIRNLFFDPVIVEGKPFLNTRGILEAVSVGKLLV